MQQQKWSHLTSKRWEEELAKCEADPCYFYNTYVKREGEPEMTQEEYEAHVRNTEFKRNKIANVSMLDRMTYYYNNYNKVVTQLESLLN